MPPLYSRALAIAGLAVATACANSQGHVMSVANDSTARVDSLPPLDAEQTKALAELVSSGGTISVATHDALDQSGRLDAVIQRYTRLAKAGAIRTDTAVTLPARWFRKGATGDTIMSMPLDQAHMALNSLYHAQTAENVCRTQEVRHQVGNAVRAWGYPKGIINVQRNDVVDIAAKSYPATDTSDAGVGCIYTIRLQALMGMGESAFLASWDLSVGCADDRNRARCGMVAANFLGVN